MRSVLPAALASSIERTMRSRFPSKSSAHWFSEQVDTVLH